MSLDAKPHVIVVGASAGGVEALQVLVSTLPGDLDAGVFIVLHTLATAESLLPGLLSRAGPLPARAAEDHALVETGRIYVAPPDRHIVFHDGVVRVVRGPKENRHRPSIDVLFRSAALALGPKVSGVLLSGADDDGTAGMMAIKRAGGVTIVQDPADSKYSDMPASAIRTVHPDYTLPVHQIGPLLAELVKGRVQRNEKPALSEPVDKSLVPNDEGSPSDDKMLGTPSVYTCPDCNGTLWELQDGRLLRYRCRVGHAYSAESVIEASADSVERALWSAVRALEESGSLSRRVAERTGFLREDLMREAVEREEHARVIRDLLTEGNA
jgi:two-component system, chemotaxis family, protein-glutamate methylesterase/glutaminase